MSGHISGIIAAIQRPRPARRACNVPFRPRKNLNETRFTSLVFFMTQLGLGSSDYTVKGLFAPVIHPFFALSHSKPSYKPR